MSASLSCPFKGGTNTAQSAVVPFPKQHDADQDTVRIIQVAKQARRICFLDGPANLGFFSFISLLLSQILARISSSSSIQ